jgi:hypothetical protein
MRLDTEYDSSTGIAEGYVSKSTNGDVRLASVDLSVTGNFGGATKTVSFTDYY